MGSLGMLGVGWPSEALLGRTGWAVFRCLAYVPDDIGGSVADAPGHIEDMEFHLGRGQPTGHIRMGRILAEAWLGTQIVVFELPEDITVGGLVGHRPCGASHRAAQNEGLQVVTEETGLGLYLLSINGTEGSGWEYFLNGGRGALAVDDAAVDSTVIVRWSLA